jgi:hypothetical protein
MMRGRIEKCAADSDRAVTRAQPDIGQLMRYGRGLEVEGGEARRATLGAKLMGARGAF